MKLLLDENLSDRIVDRIIDLYPDSDQVKTLALTNTDDGIIWKYAKANDFVIVSKDSDFHDSQFTLWSSTQVHLSSDWQQSNVKNC